MTMNTDGERLQELLGTRNRTEFAKKNKIRGGGSMISQHISGHRPISFEAAISYAKGLNVTIDRISPAAAALAQEANALLTANTQPEFLQTPSLAEALSVLGIALAREMPADVREDAADMLHKLAMRRGAERHQAELLALLQSPATKQHRSA